MSVHVLFIVLISCYLDSRVQNYKKKHYLPRKANTKCYGEQYVGRINVFYMNSESSAYNLFLILLLIQRWQMTELKALVEILESTE